MQCFGSGVQCLGPVIYQALCTSMLGKELSTGVVNMGLGEPGPRPSYVPAEVLPEEFYDLHLDCACPCTMTVSGDE